MPETRSTPRLSSILLALMLVALVAAPVTWALNRFWKMHHGERPISGQVVDETGQVVPEVVVSLEWSPGQDYVEDRSSSVNVTTDADGRFSTRVGYAFCDVGAEKPGYYRTWFGVATGTSAEGLRVVLNRVIRPQPMVGKWVSVKIPMGASRLQYDLLAGDRLPPHGKGEVADVEITWQRSTRLGSSTSASFQFRIPGEGNGLLLPDPPPARRTPRSELSSLHEAPLDGYRPMVKFQGHEFDGRLSAYLKIRSGAPGGPLYGKMFNPVFYFNRPTEDEFVFNYVINPSGDRGLEIDWTRVTVPAKGEDEGSPERMIPW